MPLAEDARVEALVICCGADCLAGDPLSTMMLSNVALWDTVERLVGLGHPTVILGGGGYNPWTLTRYWTGLWGRINGMAIPDTLPSEGTELLSAMECDLLDEDEVDSEWLTGMADSPYPGPIREAIESLADAVAPR